MKYYYTIGEVSNLIDVKPYVIRYWETEFPQLRPRKVKGRIRKFDDNQILLLKKIKYMLYDQRFTIEGARQKLKSEKQSGAQLELELLPTEKKTATEPANPKALKVLQEVKKSLVSLHQKYENYLGRDK
jgi:DNA-binding transcriptional MerR regulator